jgi:hypothetical protein
MVDPQTGAATIVSATGETTEIKGYSILSNAGTLNLVGWDSLADNPNPTYNGWDEANPNGGAINELNPVGSLTIDAATVVDLGNPIAAQGLLPFGTRAANLDISFQYSTATGEIVNGEVELIGSFGINNLYLEVDPTTGETTISNASPYTVRVGAYSILSESGSLQAGNGDWTSLSDQGVDAADEANATSEHLSEFGGPKGIVLAPGQTIRWARRSSRWPKGARKTSSSNSCGPRFCRS